MWSRQQADQPWWEEVYRKAFINFKSMVYMEDLTWQKRGVDRVIQLEQNTGPPKLVTVDEKTRRKAYPDILIEFLSSREDNRPGWVEKPLYCDYLAYAFLPTKTCLLIPFSQLQAAWRENRVDWVEEFKTREAINPGYTTISCPVPIPVLKRSLLEAMTIEWEG